MQFNNLNELISHIESIPERNFIKYRIGNEPTEACVIGHINIALHGTNQYQLGIKDYSSIELIKSFGGDEWKLADANNNATNPKEGALTYLKSLL